MRTLTAAATIFAATLTLAGCAGTGMNGTYEADLTAPDPETVEQIYGDPHALDRHYVMEITGNDCVLKTDGEGDKEESTTCEIDEDKSVIRITGEAATGNAEDDEIEYRYEDGVLTMVLFNPLRGEGDEPEDQDLLRFEKTS